MPAYRRPIFRSILWLGGLLSAIVLVGLLGRIPYWMEWGRHGLGPPAHITDLQQVKDRTHLTFPPNAVLEDGYEQGAFMSYWFIARVRLPYPQVRSFLNQSVSHGDWQTQEIDYPFQNGFHFMREHQWPIPNPKKFKSARFEGISDPASGCSVLVDLDNPQTAVIFLYFYY